MDVKEIPVSAAVKHLVSSKFGPVAYDSACGEAIKWGRGLTKQLDDDERLLLLKEGQLDYVQGERSRSLVFVQKRLTREDAIQNFGPQTEIVRGPRGGFQSITFGKKMFLSKELCE